MKKKVSILGIIIVFVIGGILVWQYFKAEEKPEEPEQQKEINQTDKYDEQIVWWDNEALDELHKCIGGEPACVKAVMEKYGAGAKAIEFYEETGWFVTEFKEYGTVDLVYLLNPWRANANDDYAMINGEPSIVVAEEEIGVGNKDIENYELLSQINPEYSIWGNDNGFIEKENDNFIFEADIKDERGCHACSSGYAAVISFQFDSEGVYQGMRLKEIKNTTNQE